MNWRLSYVTSGSKSIMTRTINSEVRSDVVTKPVSNVVMLLNFGPPHDEPSEMKKTNMPKSAEKSTAPI